MTEDLKKFTVDTRIQLAHFLQEKMGISGKKIRKLLEKNCCKINGKIERFGSVWLQKGQVVEFYLPKLERSSWQVLLDTEFFSVLFKPDNWVCSEANCHKTFHGKYFLVHRLDKDTTGALLLAKSSQVKQQLMDLFSSRVVKKTYLAIVDKVVTKDDGIIDNFLVKKGAFQGQTIWGSSGTGLHAITHWKVLKRGKSETLVECNPITGRTHQIRVHMAEMGHPLLVDRQYGLRFQSKLLAQRPLLHAYKLEFNFQSKFYQITCPLPEDFKTADLEMFKRF